MSGRWLFVGAGGFFVGVVWRSFFDFGFTFVGFVLVLAFALVLARSFAREQKSGLVLVSVFLVTFSLGIIRFDRGDNITSISLLDASVGTPITLVGTVTEEPIAKEDAQEVVLTTTSFSIGGEMQNAQTRALIRAPLQPRIAYGERLRVTGMLTVPEAFETDSGALFDYAAYLAKDAIFYQMFFPDVEHMPGRGGNPVVRTLFTVKQAFLSRLATLIPSPHTELLGGLVVGAQEALGEELLEDFRETGIIHIIVLSGYNVTIVAEALMRFFAFLPYAFSTALGVGGIVLFALLTGATPTIVRASLMALLVVLARASGRTYDITRALIVAGVLMVLHNPKIVVFDVSFQLSFLATVGLIYLAPLIERRLQFVPTRFQFREFATATIATQLFVLPLLLFRSGMLSLTALPVNLLVLPVVPLTMLFGFLTGAVAFIGKVLAVPFSFISFALLEYILRVVDWFARFPFAAVHIGIIPVWTVLALYAFLITVLLWQYQKRRKAA